MKKQQGFTLVELMIALAFSTLIAITLFSTFLQTRKTVFAIGQTSAYQMSVATLWHQLEKDLYGACIPMQFLMQLKQKSQEKKSDTPQPAATTTEKKEDSEKKIPQFKKVFSATVENDSLKQLTFITRNALAFYADKDQKDTTPLMVRVTYQLEPDSQEPTLNRLMRSQEIQLDGSAPKDKSASRSYELARRIKKCEFVFYKQEQAEKESSEQSDGQPQASDTTEIPEKKEAVSFKQLSTWSTDDLKLDDHLLPSFIELKITFALEAGAEKEERCMFEVGVSDMQMLLLSLPADQKSTSAATEQKVVSNEKVVPQGLRVSYPAGQGRKTSYPNFGNGRYYAPASTSQKNEKKSQEITVVAKTAPIIKVN